MKAKFISKYPHREYKDFVVDLEYEYRGHRYTVQENLSRGNESLSWQHRNEQDRIDRIIEMENREMENRPKHENEVSVDEALKELFGYWDSN